MATATPSLPFAVPGGDGSTPMWRVIVPLVLARDAKGLVHYAYHGAMLPWLSPEQEALLLEYGFIERVILNPVVPAAETEPVPIDLDAENGNDEILTDPEPEPETTPKTRQQRSR